MKKLIATLLWIVLVSGFAVAAITVTVKVGDSLGSIAARNDTTVAELQRLNGLKGINIRVGQVLRIPQPSSVTVRSGDSLESIASRYGISVAALRVANGISGDKIRVGQELKLSGSNPVPSNNSVSSSSVSRPSANTVTVQSGDTIGEIAQRNNISIADLRAANGLNNNSIRIGQVLKLPSKQVLAVKPTASSNTITVQSGDTLSEIANRNNTNIEDLQAVNNLSGNAIRVGQVLKLPKTIQSTSKPIATIQTTTGGITVQAGDNLEKIAKRNNISVAALRVANNLSGDSIRVGDTLRLPSSTATQKPVVVSKPSITKPKPNVIAAKPKPNVIAAKPNVKPTVSSKPSTTATKPSVKPTISSKPTTTKPVVSSQPVVVQPTKPVVTATKPSVKPTISSKPTTTKPVVSSQPVVVQPTKPVVTATKPVVTATKPTVAAKPVMPTKPQASNTRVIAPPPNLPTATGRTVTIQPLTIQAAKPVPKPQNVAATPTKPSALPPIQTVTAPKPTAPAATPTNVARQPTAVKPSPVIPVKPDSMPSTLGFNEPLELLVSEDSSLIDPALESPFFDATAPESKPTAPSDLAPEDIEIIIPDNQSAASVKPTPNSPTFSRSEKLLWPLSGTMTSRFGWRSLRGNRYHTGIDLAAPTGTRVYAALSGTVEFAGWNRQGYGYLVIIRGWDNRRYYYGHNSRLQVKKGQWVRQGQVISRVGSTGFSTGPHLHFEIRVGNSARNPLAYLPRSRLALASSQR
jgi:murein DD-endopeptidase MepM/ murein hydrolase activator NlpD